MDGITNSMDMSVSTMDGVHPQDLGFALMADKIESVMRRAMMEYDCFGEGV